MASRSRKFMILPASAMLLGACSDPRALAEPPGNVALAGSFPEQTPLDAAVLDYSSVELAPGVADVTLRVGALTFDAHFDYAAGEVVTDGHGQRLDREAHALLRRATAELAGADPAATGALAEAPPFAERALYAALVVWGESGGVVVGQRRFEVPVSGRSVEKSLLDDGVACVDRGLTYAVSYDFDGVTVQERLVQADARNCNGLCGPACVLLTPFSMWTLDCLEHDACCAEIDGDAECWVPLGECGDEYEGAVSDFLVGVDPFADHCSG